MRQWHFIFSQRFAGGSFHGFYIYIKKFKYTLPMVDFVNAQKAGGRRWTFRCTPIVAMATAISRHNARFS
ncbi:hypothetical protein F3P66_02415 [Agrobacterium fabrum]|uniref:Uncharacterized protein n=1 Tax=Agrobacterium fabrum (strain C58 / ATCC 33970) TaxID=176299 RepID=Q8UCW5_AGRFC|nr:hypothetical protein Atu2368 [Agrobacterium fabrum str. C58]QRM60557.1 hypothetical protein F3P66_02415 [Agrobacterium fabrum]TRB29425.1 hypothetical protein EXN51_11590 [Agrobacterium fabrum]